MSTRTIVVAALVLLAGAAAGAAAAPAAVGAAADRPSTAVGTHDVARQDDAGNDTEITYRNLTVRQVQLVGVSIETAVLNDTSLRGANDTTSALGTATASNLTVVDATLSNVTMSNVTIRNRTVATQLFGEEPPEGETATVDNATLSNVTIESFVVEAANASDIDVDDVQASVSPGTDQELPVPDRPTVEVDTLTVGNGTLASVEADQVTVENASAGIGLAGGLGPTGTVGNASEDNETGALVAPVR